MPIVMFTRKKVIVALITATAAAVGFACYWYGGAPRTGARPLFPSTPPVSIDISVSDRPLATITNPVAMGHVMEMLRFGRSVEAHKCKNRGVMVLQFSDEKALRVSFLPGHHLFRYEFMTPDGVFAVSRSLFLRTLKDAGLDVERL